jgi:hypothetical protein
LKRRSGGNGCLERSTQKLTVQAEQEGVSINSFVTAIIAEAIGSRQANTSKRQ